jgi:hypothetical protein
VKNEENNCSPIDSFNLILRNCIILWTNRLRRSKTLFRPQGDDYGIVTKGISPDDRATRGIRPDIVEYQKTPAPYFRKAEADAKLETGTLQVEVIDRFNRLPIKTIKVHFVKIRTQETGEQVLTEGLGYTDAIGVYRIDGVPIGKYSIEVAGDRRYFFESRGVEIIANTENLVNFQLEPERDTLTKGIRVD